MWIRTHRIKSICLFFNNETESEYQSIDDPELMIGFAGLRVGKNKEGVWIYCNRCYRFFPWSRIKKMIIMR